MRGGDVLQRARRRSGLSADELAGRLGVDAAQVLAWEGGDPPFSVVDQAVEACGVQLHLVPAELAPEPELHDPPEPEEGPRLGPDERLERMMRYVRFIEAGRSALRGAKEDA